VEAELDALLRAEDEAQLDRRWRVAASEIRTYALRPAKRLRPLLLAVGYGMAAGGPRWPAELVRFSAATELLHSFILIHDDVADRADIRRGGPTLHRLLGPGRVGDDLAVVAGDYLFAHSLESMLRTGLPHAPRAAIYYLGVCRHTAVGQFLDLELSRAPLDRVALRSVLRVALLKTAKYGFVAPLSCGAVLAGARPGLLEVLERVGRCAGLAFQLRDDILGLFGDARLSGKGASADFAQGKRTFPVVAAYVRAPPQARRELESLWSLRTEDPLAVARARLLVERHGGLAATERAVARMTRCARAAVSTLPPANGVRSFLDNTLRLLERREG